MRVAAAAVALLAAGIAHAQAPAAPVEGFGWFASLAGHCWKGEHPDGKTSDTQCYATQYGKFVRGTIRIASGAGAHEGDSVFQWDGKASRLRYTQWSSGGSLASGEAYYEGDVLRFPDRPRADGGAVTGRTSWTRIDASTFRVARERLQGGAWTEAFAVTYRRVP